MAFPNDLTPLPQHSETVVVPVQMSYFNRISTEVDLIKSELGANPSFRLGAIEADIDALQSAPSGGGGSSAFPKILRYYKDDREGSQVYYDSTLAAFFPQVVGAVGKVAILQGNIWFGSDQGELLLRHTTNGTEVFGTAGQVYVAYVTSSIKRYAIHRSFVINTDPWELKVAFSIASSTPRGLERTATKPLDLSLMVG